MVQKRAKIAFYALVGRSGFSRASCTPLLRAGGRSLSVWDRAREGFVMSCAENGGSIPTNGGAVSRRVREEASSDAPFGPFF